MLRTACWVGFLLIGTACPPPALCPGGEGVPVIVQLVNDGQAFTGDASVSYVMADGDERDCVAHSSGDNAYACGTDQTGEYEINVVVSGRQDVSEDVSVSFDECRLQTQTVEVSVGAECEETSAPSVHVLVQDSNAGPIEGATVKHKLVSEAGSMVLCDPSTEVNGFDCGDNIAGEFRISAQKADFQGLEQAVTVTMGTCHVETELLVFQLESTEGGS